MHCTPTPRLRRAHHYTCFLFFLIGTATLERIDPAVLCVYLPRRGECIVTPLLACVEHNHEVPEALGPEEVDRADHELQLVELRIEARADQQIHAPWPVTPAASTSATTSATT